MTDEAPTMTDLMVTPESLDEYFEENPPEEGVPAEADPLDGIQRQPVANVRWVPIEKVHPNDYNPNKVPARELRLLYHSILSDGYTQPVVTIYEPETDTYCVVDGFHRYTVMLRYADIRRRCRGLLPIVVIDKPINDRMASTVRHNRARGKHSVRGMSQIVLLQMLENGWSDAEVCAELGMEAEELLRLKYITGFAKLFEDVEYRKAWETRRQILLRRQYREGQEGNSNSA